MGLKAWWIVKVMLIATVVAGLGACDWFGGGSRLWSTRLSYDAEGQLTSKVTANRDASGRVTQLDITTDEPAGYQLFTYTDEGYYERDSGYDATGTETWYWEISYDDDGYRTAYTASWTDGEPVSYTQDQIGVDGRVVREHQDDQTTYIVYSYTDGVDEWSPSLAVEYFAGSPQYYPIATASSYDGGTLTDVATYTYEDGLLVRIDHSPSGTYQIYRY